MPGGSWLDDSSGAGWESHRADQGVLVVGERLAAVGAELRYHGDFDWPGIAIANVLVGTYGCRPWRFGTSDYLTALTRFAPTVAELPPLGPAPTQACWDPQLTHEMARAGRAVHEELVLDELLADLANPDPS